MEGWVDGWVSERTEDRAFVGASEWESVYVYVVVCACMYDAYTRVKVVSLSYFLNCFYKFQTHYYITSNVLLTSTF